MLRLRICESAWTELSTSILLRNDVETAGLLLGRLQDAVPEPVLIIEETVVLPDDAYEIREVDRLRLDPVVLNQFMRRARDRGLAVFTIHSHPGATRPWFSWADDRGDTRLMPSFEAQIPDVPHGSIVVVPGGAAVARTHRDGAFLEVRLAVVGRRLRLPTLDPARADEAFSRQVLALGETGQTCLRALRVGVVGLGGTGSITAVQLAHLGIGALVLVDGDRLARSNVSRVVGGRVSDVGQRKVDVVARAVRDVALPVEVTTVASHVTGEEQLRALRGCDVVFSCVDRHAPRALLNRLAYASLVPVIDMGTAFRVDSGGTIIGDAGRVVTVGPERRCLACWGHVDPERLRIEALSPEDRENEEIAGYVSGANVPEPSVIPFNVVASGLAVVELLRLVTTFGEATEVNRLSLSFVEPGLRRNALAGTGCRICRTPARLPT